MSLIEESLNKLKIYIEKENYQGYDPYDALNSPLFKLPFFRSNKLIRFYLQQFGKRFPVNLRSLLSIGKSVNPVTLGLCVQAYSCLYLSAKENLFLENIKHLINELEKLIPEGYHGACWGYNFDWEARNAKIPAYQPTVVATGIISNALFEYYKITKNEKALELFLSACSFVLQDLNRTYNDETFCFSYSPFDNQKVLNASMKGSRMLAQAYSITKNHEFLYEAKKSVGFVINKQDSDGSWSYSDKRENIDNYHTGYILDCLDEFIKCTGDKDYCENLNMGIEFYKENFFEEDGFPKFFSNDKFPLDCTAGAQSILTLIRFGEIDLAEKTAEYLIRNMQDKVGFFYFRKFKNYTIKTSFMRWSNAWMFLALSCLISKKNSN